MSILRALWPFFDVEDDTPRPGPGGGPRRNGFGVIVVEVGVSGTGQVNEVVAGNGAVTIDVGVAAEGRVFVAPFIPPPVLSGGAGGYGNTGGGVPQPGLLREIARLTFERWREPEPPPPPPVELPGKSLALMGAGILLALVGTKVLARRAESPSRPTNRAPVAPRRPRVNDAPPDVPRVNDSPVALRWTPTAPPSRPAPLKIAKGRQTGRQCAVCKFWQPVTAFRSCARHCDACKSEGRHRVFQRVCRQCKRPFESPSSRALVCEHCGAD